MDTEIIKRFHRFSFSQSLKALYLSIVKIKFQCNLAGTPFTKILSINTRRRRLAIYKWIVRSTHYMNDSTISASQLLMYKYCLDKHMHGNTGKDNKDKKGREDNNNIIIPRSSLSRATLIMQVTRSLQYFWGGNFNHGLYESIDLFQNLGCSWTRFSTF